MPDVPRGTQDLDRQIFELQNKARGDPKALVPHLQEMLSRFEQNNLLKQPGKTTLRTKEGPAAVNEAIEYLNRLAPVPLLKWNEELGQAAQDHAKDSGPKGLV